MQSSFFTQFQFFFSVVLDWIAVKKVKNGKKTVRKCFPFYYFIKKISSISKFLSEYFKTPCVKIYPPFQDQGFENFYNISYQNQVIEKGPTIYEFLSNRYLYYYSSE